MQKIVALILILILTACDCGQTASGKIVDFHTGQPIDSVMIEAFYPDGSSLERTYFTDTSGHFDVFYIFGGGLSGCPDINVEFKKAGYTSLDITLKNDSTKIVEDTLLKMR